MSMSGTNSDDSDSLWWSIAGSAVLALVLSILIHNRNNHNNNNNNNNNKTKPWPVVPGARFLLGNSLGKGGLGNLITQFTEWIIQYGNVPSNPTGLLEVNLYGRHILLICNNTFALELCKLRPNKIRRPPSEIESVKSVGADGVFSAEGTQWSQDRRIMAPPLNQKNLQDYLPFIQTITKRLVQKWADASDQPVPINRDLMSIMIDYIGMIAFDQDFDCLRRPNSQEAKDLQYVFAVMGMRGFSPIEYWKLPIIGQYLDGVGFSRRRLLQNIQSTMDSYSNNNNASNGSRSKTYLQKLLDQKEMPHPRVMGNLMTMFAAGSETTGNTTMLCFWELLREGSDPVFGQEIVEEILQFEQSTGGIALDSPQLTMDVFAAAIPKLRALFYEVVRFNGTAPALVLSVSAPEGVTIQGLYFAHGTDFYLPLQYLGTLEDSGIPLGPNGEARSVFCPRRWLSPKATSSEQKQEWNVTKPSPKTGVSIWSGFGSGVRICPGQDLAELESTYLLACILQHFDVSLMPHHPPIQLVTSFTMSPDIDIQLVLKPRQQK